MENINEGKYEGKYEIFTTKADAINKFRQMQGICREELTDRSRIEFRCSRKGKITVTNPKRRSDKTVPSSTMLFANVVEQDGKTYVTYYTTYSGLNNAFNFINITIMIIMCIIAIVLAVTTDDMISPILLGLSLLLYIYELFRNSKEKTNFPKDAEIMVNELKKRVEAINLWDK